MLISKTLFSILKQRFNTLSLSLLLTLIVSTQVSAETFYYTGIISDGLEIQMQLDLQGTLATGQYYYNAVGSYLDLTGSLEGNTLRLEEYTQNSSSSPNTAAMLTGTFTGELSNTPTDFADSFIGEWRNPFGNRFNFSLEKLAEFVTIDISQGRISATTSYPYFVTPSHNALNRFLQSTFIDRQIDFLREGQELIQLEDLYNSWILESTTSISYASLDLVSLKEEIYIFTGGAHGNIGFDSHNLMLESSGLRILELRDMFAPRSAFMDVLAPTILDELSQQNAAYVLDGSVSGLSENDLQIFSISPDGLRFAFEPYIMGPYVEGPYEVFISYDLLAPFINEISPLKRFIN